MLDRDKRRWNAADEDNDGTLSREEFAAFLHPEETSHMRNIVLLETIEDIDKNKDGKLSLDEYIGNFLSPIVMHKIMIWILQFFMGNSLIILLCLLPIL